MKNAFEKDKLKLWTIVCVLSAAPSFYWSLAVKANIIAMIIGVVLFILGYTITTSSNFYKKLEQKLFLFKALKWAFKVRVLYSIISLFLFFIPAHCRSFNVLDFWLGWVSISITDALVPNNNLNFNNDLPANFLPTLFTTITQGILLSLAVFALAVVFWLFLRTKHAIFPSTKVYET